VIEPKPSVPEEQKTQPAQDKLMPSVAQMPGSSALIHGFRGTGMALTDNTEILKVINMNKM